MDMDKDIAFKSFGSEDRTGNGLSTFICFDNWHPNGPLLQPFSRRMVTDW